MFDQLKGLGELLALAQDDEKRTAIIAQVTAPIHQLAAATAELARQQQAMRAELAEHHHALVRLLDLVVPPDQEREPEQINIAHTQEAPPHGN